MKTIRIFSTILTLGLSLNALFAQVPPLINYQGRVVVGTSNFTGPGQFKFALVGPGGTPTFWSNNGTSVAGSEPGAAVSLTVANGLYAVLLGDATLPNMTVIPATVFTNADVRLRVWFSDGVTGSQLFTPDQRIAAVGYAMMSANVPDGAITANKLANGAVTGLKIADGAITSSKLAPNTVTSSNISDTIALGQTNVNGRLDVYLTAAGTPSITLDGASSVISTFGSDGLEQIRLHGTTWGELLLRNSLPNNATAVNLSAQSTTGGRLSLNNTNGNSRAILEGENTGGLLTLYTADGNTGAILYGNEGQGSGALSLRNTNGSARFRAYGGPTSGLLQMFDADGTETFTANADGNGSLVLRQGDGTSGVGLFANNGSGGAGVTVYRDDGTFAGQLTVANATQDDGYLGLANRAGATRFYARASSSGDSQGGYVGIRNSAGVQTITLDADSAGDGRIITQVLQITGGSDLSENFDINAGKDELLPGMIVSIDPKNVGELVLCKQAFDKKVAGIVSGAGGVKTGMLMGQAGTKADGKHPVALTGRVYCWVDADAGGPVEAGDLITTSNTPGHGMRVGESTRASGAIIGKAMSPLEKGKGLVLVLVSLQ